MPQSRMNKSILPPKHKMPDIAQICGFIVQQLSGKSQVEIAKKTKIAERTLNYKLRTPVAQALRDYAVHLYMTEFLGIALENVREFLTDKSPEGRDHRYKQTQAVLQATGIAPAHASAQINYFQQIFMQQNNLTLDPRLAETLTPKLVAEITDQGAQEGEVIDV